MDLCALVRRDHDDLDRALSAMTSTTPLDELPELLDVFRLALAVHMTAEARVLDALLEVATTPRDALRWLVAQVQQEHALQQAAADDLTVIVPGSAAWYDRALRLRSDVLDHTTRADLMRAAIEAHLPKDDRRMLASRFATERMRVLSTTPPLGITRDVRVA